MFQYGYNTELPFRFAALASVFFGFLLMLAMPSAGVAQVETQNAFNFPWQAGKHTELTLHGRFRTRPGLLGSYQARTGVILRQEAAPRVGLIAGYYFADQENDEAQWKAWHRYFAGFDYKIAEWKGSWETRHLAEHFDVPGAGNYYRVRHRGGWTAPTRVAPFANVEYFWDREGWRSTRWQGGVGWHISPRVWVDAHYFYEPRRGDVGLDARHMWGTTLRIPIGKIR
jgi:hypothetical protein